MRNLLIRLPSGPFTIPMRGNEEIKVESPHHVRV